MAQPPARATIDFETRSECELKKHGSWRYSLDETTEILCLAFRLPYWKKGRTALWHPAFPHLAIYPSPQNWKDLQELFKWIEAGGLVEAHNAWFERGVWANEMVGRGAPPIPHRQWRCSAAKGAAHSLPRGLGDMAFVLDVDEQKDEEGESVMKKLTKPRKPKKADIRDWARKHAPCDTCKGVGKTQEFKKNGEPKLKLSRCAVCRGYGHIDTDLPPMPTLWLESNDLFNELFDYCRQDVLAEEASSEAIPDLSPNETELYLLDQAINERGFQLDPRYVTIALRLISAEVKLLNGELFELTEGKVERATQRERMKAWFAERGLELENTQAATIEEALEVDDLTPEVRRGLELMQLLGKSSTSKYITMKRWMCPDSRVRGGLLFHGAGTGRWSGAGVQPHNFVKGKVKDMATLWSVLEKGTREEIIDLYGDVMTALSNALRGAITCAEGNRLYVADYNAIEARVVLWVAEDEKHLGIFRRGEDIYLDMASSIYGRVCADNPSPERDLGKIAVLGLGFQMGWKKFRNTCAKFKIVIDDDMAQRVVTAYRDKFWRVKKLWKTVEDAAIEAVRNPGEVINAGKTDWVVEGDFLYCILPSGRKLAYPEPKVQMKQTSWGDLKETLTFKGVNPKTRQWQRMSAYGGLLVENIVQAIARDLMAEAMLRCELSGTYLPVLSVHDELIAEAKEDEGSVKEFEGIMTLLPTWAEGLPVAAAGWTGFLYRK